MANGFLISYRQQVKKEISDDISADSANILKLGFVGPTSIQRGIIFQNTLLLDGVFMWQGHQGEYVMTPEQE